MRDFLLDKGGYVALGMVLTMALFSFYGCTGDEGAAGLPGLKGPPGEPGPVTTTNESCMVCHDAGSIADVAVAHPDPVEPTVTSTITGADVDPGTGLVTVTFSLNDYTIDVADPNSTRNVRFTIAQLNPAAGGDASYWQSYINQQETMNVGDPGSATPPNTTDQATYERGNAGTMLDLGGGVYAYTFSFDIRAVTNPVAVAYDQTLTHRVAMQVPGNADNAVWDFVPDGVTPLATREVVLNAACNECHRKLGFHGGDRIAVEYCVTCHNPGTTDANSDNTVDLKVMVHKIHRGADLPSGVYTIWGHNNSEHDFTHVEFPQDIRNCTKCHVGGADSDNWMNVPTIEVCTSCHDDLDITDPATTHGGGQRTDNSLCAGCHPATGVAAAITEAHAIVPAAADTSEFDVTISMSPDANIDGVYDAGETPVVTVTLNHAGGGAVDPAFYTTAQGAEGDTGDTALSDARLYVYGPRARAVPVLTTGSTTDPAWDPTTAPTQAHMLFAGGTDPLVQTDATGFKYQLLAIPADMEPGTYMVRFEGADYGGISSSDYVTSSSTVITFQVGTAVPELKVAGDSCTDCHGDSIMHLTGSHAHHAPFNTDHCLACHDQSGNYAVPIANRAHAVHSANSDGDLYAIRGSGTRDWSHISYPQDVDVCNTCHSSGNDSYLTNPFMMPCAGCHVVEGNGVIDHMRQNGGPF